VKKYLLPIISVNSLRSLIKEFWLKVKPTCPISLLRIIICYTMLYVYNHVVCFICTLKQKRKKKAKNNFKLFVSCQLTSSRTWHYCWQRRFTHASSKDIENFKNVFSSSSFLDRWLLMISQLLLWKFQNHKNCFRN
jgi:hypothetical protein